MIRFPTRGGRIIKTGIAAFLTAFICDMLGWSPAFAVITAIVTIEPTVSDSIRKGFVRFPASAIGAFYTVTFVSIFGHAPITYALSAVLTIATSYKLKLHDGLLVATLTAVAMVDAVQGEFLASFGVRLGATTIGLLVSTAVNMFVLPPDYTREIDSRITRIQKNINALLGWTGRHFTDSDPDFAETVLGLTKQTRKEIAQAEALAHFQEKDNFHPFVSHDQENLEWQMEQLHRLEQVVYHIENMMQTPTTDLTWSEHERNMIVESIERLIERIGQKIFDHDAHATEILQLTKRLFAPTNDTTYDSIPSEVILLYELIALYEQIAKCYANEHPTES